MRCCVSTLQCAGLVISSLKLFREKHRERIRLFTWFVVVSSISMLFLLGYTISLFVSYSSTREGFLATGLFLPFIIVLELTVSRFVETLEVSFIIMIVVAILTLITITRGSVKREHDLSSRGSASRASKSHKDDTSNSPTQSNAGDEQSTPKASGITRKDSSSEEQIETGKITI